MYLNCKTYFSVRWGTYSTSGLVEEAVEAGASALALTNINSTCDAWDFVLFCQQKNIKPILGAEIRNGDKLLYILIAANNKGFTWINHFLSRHIQQDQPFPAQTQKEPFFLSNEDGFVIYPLDSKPPDQLLPNEFIGIQPGEVNRIFSWPDVIRRTKLVVRQPVTFQNKIHFNVHRLLR